MRQITSVALAAPAVLSLKALQAEVDSVSSYEDRVRFARKRFQNQNQGNNVTFDEVKRQLKSMCLGPSRCMYCEDSLASEVEHFKPKAFYPELTFVWDNYLYACGPCNRTKLSRFRVHVGHSSYSDLVRPRNVPVVPPVSGAPVLIDPRAENPLLYITLDLVNTFRFRPRHADGTPEYARSDYTIKLLKLNDREHLPAIRRIAYSNYRARLKEYVDARGTAQATPIEMSIRLYGFSAVWLEMKAQSSAINELGSLFANAPEALSW